MDKPTDAISRAIAIAGSSQAKLAAAITAAGKKCTQQTVSYWVNELDGVVPPEWGPFIEAATGGGVTRHDLRPDIFGPAPAAKRARAAA